MTCNTNPWSGLEESEFLKYCCPECEFKNENLQLFENHALENHSNAHILFTTIDTKDELQANIFYERKLFKHVHTRELISKTINPTVAVAIYFEFDVHVTTV